MDDGERQAELVNLSEAELLQRLLQMRRPELADFLRPLVGEPGMAITLLHTSKELVEGIAEHLRSRAKLGGLLANFQAGLRLDRDDQNVLLRPPTPALAVSPPRESPPFFPNRVDNPFTSPTQATVPGDIKLEPSLKFVFNAPFSEKKVFRIRLTNRAPRQSGRTGRIGWTVKTTSPKRLAVWPSAGCLDAAEGLLLTIACEPFNPGSEDTGNDRLCFEWTNTPEGAAKHSRSEWLRCNCTIRRQNLFIEYNH